MGTAILDTLLAVCLALLGGAFYCQGRANKLLAYRRDHILRMGMAVMADHSQGKPWEWRLEAYKRLDPPTWKVVYSFRPIASFYPDQSFCDPYATEK